MKAIPKGWRKLNVGSMIYGYAWISNGKSIFKKGYKQNRICLLDK